MAAETAETDSFLRERPDRRGRLRRLPLLKRVLAALALLLALASSALAAPPSGSPQLLVEDIQCRGNATTSCRFIRGYLYLHAGQVLDEREIRDATLRLSWLQNFKSVDIHLEKGSEKGRVIVVIEVVEASSITDAVAAGFASRFGSLTQTLSADIGDRNLFGTGKSLDLSIALDTSLTGNVARQRFARLEYFDPQLFDSTRLFFGAGLYGIDSDYRFDNGDRLENRAYGADTSLGLRFGRFSYFAVGYRYLPHASLFSLTLESDGQLDGTAAGPRSQVLLSYGFNTQDDVYFPTRGGRFNLYLVRGGGNEVGLEYSHAWRIGDESFLRLHGLLEPVRFERGTSDNASNLGLAYEHTLAADGLFGGIRRGRWFVAPGLTPGGRDAGGRLLVEAGVRAGVILETRSLGYVSLYVFGSGTVTTSGH